MKIFPRFKIIFLSFHLCFFLVNANAKNKAKKCKKNEIHLSSVYVYVIGKRHDDGRRCCFYFSINSFVFTTHGLFICNITGLTEKKNDKKNKIKCGMEVKTEEKQH